MSEQQQQQQDPTKNEQELNDNVQNNDNVSDRESNWEDASQQSQDDVIWINDQNLQEIENEIFFAGEEAKMEDEEGKEEEPVEVLPDMSVSTFKYHMDSVYSLAISPSNPNLMVSGGGDDIAVLWNIQDPENTVNVLEGHKDTVDHVAFNFDGKLIATGSMDSTVGIWDSETGKKKFTLDGPGAEITFVDFHPKGNAIIAGSVDTTLWMWNAANGTFYGALTGHEQAVTCGKFSLDGKLIVSGSDDSTMKIWNPKSLECNHTIKGHGFHEEGLTSITFQEKNPVIASASTDKTVCLTNWSTGKVLGRTDLHDDAVEGVVFPKNFDIFITGSLDGKIRIFDSNKFSLKERFPFDAGITKVGYDNNKNVILASTTSGIMYIFDHRTNESAIKLTGNNSCINDFQILSEHEIVAAGDDGRILLFDVRKV